MDDQCWEGQAVKNGEKVKSELLTKTITERELV
jgi:hypothetical protein